MNRKASYQFNVKLPMRIILALRAQKRRLELSWEAFFDKVLDLLGRHT